MNLKIKMPYEVQIALNMLNSNGFEAFIVGGCVRDALLNIIPSDWDITTSANPSEIKFCFKKYKTLDIGLKHGTVTVVINHMSLEITTYRIDGKYTDNRRPDTVIFTDKLSMDLKRRDVTVNSLAYNSDGLVDLFGGINDIKNKTIRCVGEPDERFTEDGLRILRALRFASVLDFNIHEKTSKSIHKNKRLLNNISFERINNEFNKLVLGRNFYNVMLEFKDVIEVLIPEIKKISCENWEKKLYSMSLVSNDVIEKFAAFFYKINDVEKILFRLKNSNETIKNVALLTSNLDEEILPDVVNVKKWLNKIGCDNFKKLVHVKIAIFKSFNSEDNLELENLNQLKLLANEVVEENQCYSLKTLAISGKDIIDAGITEGKQIGEILNEVLLKVIEGKLLNQKSVLIDYIKFYKK